MEMYIPLSTFRNKNRDEVNRNNQVIAGLLSEAGYQLPEAMVSSDGKVHYIPVLVGNRTEDKRLPGVRSTSFTRFMLWYINQYQKLEQGYMLSQEVITAETLQPLQDLIVKWAGETLVNTDWTFEEVKGAAIVEAYATGPSSCMKGKIGQLALYVQNPEKVSLLKVYEKGAYKGRAILWTLDDGNRMLDRIYPGNGTLAFAARSYAKSKGWLTQTHDGIGAGSQLDGVTTTLKHPNNRRLPYLDNLHYVHKCGQESITLGNKGSKVYPRGLRIKLPSVGSYAGFSSTVYSRYRTITGAYAVNPLHVDVIRGYARFTNIPNDKVHRYYNGGSVVRLVLNPGDPVVYNATKTYFVRSDSMVQVGEYWYFRNQVRKVRNRNEFVPKIDAQPHVITTDTFQGWNVMVEAN